MPFGDPAGYLPRVKRSRKTKISNSKGGTNPFGSPTFNSRGKSVRAESRIAGGGQSGTPEDSKPGTTYRPRHARGTKGQKRPT